MAMYRRWWVRVKCGMRKIANGYFAEDTGGKKNVERCVKCGKSCVGYMVLLNIGQHKV